MPDFFSHTRKTGQHHTPEMFGGRFDAAWDRLSQRFFKFECQQYYDEGADGPYHDFVRGDHEALVEHLTALRREDLPFFQQARDRGAHFVRVHAIVKPLTEYMKYEFYSYSISELLGERILTIDLSVAETIAGASLQDFLLFDGSVLFAQTYDSGILRDAHETSDANNIAHAVELAERLLHDAHDFREDFTLDRALEARLRQSFQH